MKVVWYYFRGYRTRLSSILLAILLSVSPLTFTSLIFGNKTNQISGQLNTLERAEYSSIYLLNYDSPLSNEWIYADTDVMVFDSQDQEKRIGVSCLMCQDESLKSGEATISNNVATANNLSVGDSLFAVFPFSPNVFEYTVKAITPTEFDYQNPNVDNNIGILRFGLVQEYVNSTNCHYIVFSDESQTNTLAGYPQILNAIITKRSLESNVFYQGLAILIILFIMSVVSTVLSEKLFFSKSFDIIRLYYLKGVSKHNLVWVPFIEQLFLSLFVIAVAELLIGIFIPMNSNFTYIYFAIPIATSLFTMLISVLKNTRKCRERSVNNEHFGS